jgi:hypothetical protein
VRFASAEAAGRIRFGIFLLACALASVAIATFVHEVFGHALVGTLAGGRVTAIHVSAFGGGYVRGVGGHLSTAAGMLAEAVLAIVALAWAKRARGYAVALGLTVLGSVAAMGPVFYLFDGLNVGYGDPWNLVVSTSVELARAISRAPLIIVVQGAIAGIAGCVAWRCMRRYFALQDTRFPARSGGMRIRTTVAVLGLPMLLAAACFLLASLGGDASGQRQRSAALETGGRDFRLSDCMDRARLEPTRASWSRTQRRDGLLRCIKTLPPPDPIPATIAFFGAVLAGATAAFTRGSRAPRTSTDDPSWRTVVLTSLASFALVLAVGPLGRALAALLA